MQVPKLRRSPLSFFRVALVYRRPRIALAKEACLEVQCQEFALDDKF